MEPCQPSKVAPQLSMYVCVYVCVQTDLFRMTPFLYLIFHVQSLMSDIYNIFEFLNLKFQVRIDFILKVDLFFFFFAVILLLGYIIVTVCLLQNLTCILYPDGIDST